MRRLNSLLVLVVLLSATARAASHSAAWPAWRTMLCKDGPARVHSGWKHGKYAVPPAISRIMLAAFEGRTAAMRRGLAALPAKDRARWRLTALATAAEGNQPATIHALISDGADPDARDWVPPHRPQASRQVTDSPGQDRRPDTRRGADALRKAEMLDNSGEYLPPPLFEVMSCNRVDVARVLLEDGASVHVTQVLNHHRRGMDPLLGAAFNGDVQILRLMLAHGADSCHDDRLMARAARHSGRKPVPTVARIADEHGVPAALVGRLRCPAS